MLNDGAEIQARDAEGGKPYDIPSPLSYMTFVSVDPAACRGVPEIVQFLLDQGSYTSTYDLSERIPLMRAAEAVYRSTLTHLYGKEDVLADPCIRSFRIMLNHSTELDAQAIDGTPPCTY